MLDVERGLKGFVPRNYVQPLDNLPTLEEFNRILDGVRDKVIGSKIPDKERGTKCKEYTYIQGIFLSVLAKTQFVQNAKTQFEKAKTQFEN